VRERTSSFVFPKSNAKAVGLSGAWAVCCVTERTEAGV
jgi:hypothetical protein